MPNHVQNIVNFNCPPERIKEILTGIQADDPEEQEENEDLTEEPPLDF